ncbi:MAG: beta-hydroxyacyl-ACP dehydratase [Planctomycetaceae bacterium]|nr:beta-hydroxyacyl-ACP dehydratase [Planctomycetaceae bacterium]
MPPRKLYDYSQYDFDNPMYTIDDIRKINPQRHAMEQLTGIVYIDEEGQGLVGFKDITDDEFWCTGHMPGFPLMPGVIQCEAAAQLGGFFARKYDLLGGEYLGFGGMESVRFRRSVFPGSRLIILIKVIKVRPGKRVVFDFQGFVEDVMVFNGTMIGVPINRGSEL